MTIEIHTPGLERRLQREFQSGRFGDIDELLTVALNALQERDSADSTAPQKPLSVAEALNSPPFLHSGIFIPERSKEQSRPAEL